MVKVKKRKKLKLMIKGKEEMKDMDRENIVVRYEKG